MKEEAKEEEEEEEEESCNGTLEDSSRTAVLLSSRPCSATLDSRSSDSASAT